MRRVNELKMLDNGNLQKVNEWALTGWFEKSIYVLGWVSLIFLALSFISGFVSGYIGS